MSSVAVVPPSPVLSANVNNNNNNNNNTTTSPNITAAAAPSSSSSAPSAAASAAASQPYASASLYVGELNPDVTEALLFEIFNAVGPVASVRVCRDAATRRSLGYAYVNFHRLEDAERALDTLNFKALRGRACRIMWSHRDPSLRRSGVGNVFVNHLAKEIDNKQLYDTFSVFGNILSCKVAVGPKGESLGYGFVHFETDESANAAILRVHGKVIAGLTVSVEKFMSKKDRPTASNKNKYTNVFIKNLPLDITVNKLDELFRQFGTITSSSVNIPADRNDEKARAFGFLNFETADQAAVAVDGGNNIEIAGKKLFVGRAQKKEERQKELAERFENLKLERAKKYAGVNLFIKNLADEIDDERLTTEFSKFGQITSATVMRDSATTKSRGFGFVCFTTPEEATKAVTDMNGKMLENKPLYVALAQRKEQRRAQLEAQYAARQKLGGINAPLNMNAAAAAAAMNMNGMNMSAAMNMVAPNGMPLNPAMYPNNVSGQGMPAAAAMMFSSPQQAAAAAQIAQMQMQQQRVGGVQGLMNYPQQFMQNPGAPMNMRWNPQQNMMGMVGGPQQMRGPQLNYQLMPAGAAAAAAAAHMQMNGRGNMPGVVPINSPQNQMNGNRGPRTNNGNNRMNGGAGMAPNNQTGAGMTQVNNAAAAMMQGSAGRVGVPVSGPVAVFASNVRNQSGAAVQAPAAPQQLQQRTQPPSSSSASGGLEPLTPSALALAPEEMRKQMIGERLFPLVRIHDPDQAGKITGMLLEMDNSELLHLLESSQALQEKIMEARQVLSEAHVETDDQ